MRFDSTSLIECQNIELTIIYIGIFMMSKWLLKSMQLSQQAAARFIHGTLRNSSMTISNVVGPVEAKTLANHPVKGLYFMTLGSPQVCCIFLIFAPHLTPVPFFWQFYIVPLLISNTQFFRQLFSNLGAHKLVLYDI